jgi:hypothetical protein
LEIEMIEDRLDRKQPIDHDVYAKLVNSRERGFEKLAELRTQARAALPPERAPGSDGWPSALARHLHFMIWCRERCGDANPSGKLHDDLLAEYEERERRNEFVGQEVNGFVCGSASGADAGSDAGREA